MEDCSVYMGRPSRFIPIRCWSINEGWRPMDWAVTHAQLPGLKVILPLQTVVPWWVAQFGEGDKKRPHLRFEPRTLAGPSQTPVPRDNHHPQITSCYHPHKSIVQHTYLGSWVWVDQWSPDSPPLC